MRRDIGQSLSNTFKALFLGLSLCAPAFAESGLVTVRLTNINTEIARNINVEVSQIPVTVQAPIGVAANVCNVDANVLASQAREGEATCDAQTSSQALNQIVQRQIGG